MTLWACADDDVRYSAGASACPQCGATDHYEAGSPEHLAALATNAAQGPPEKPATPAGPASGRAADKAQS